LARPCSTICLPLGKDAYLDLIGDPARFRAWLDGAFRDCPELFPRAFAGGYTLQDCRASARTGLRPRRVLCKSTGQSSSARPSSVLPYQAALAEEAEGPLFLRTFGVPYRAVARVFGKGPMYWYRLEVGLGRNSVAGTAARRGKLPEHPLADEHHQPRDGVKNHIATAVGAGCCLGAALAQTASAEALQAAYGAFKREAQNARPGYRPGTASVDGWAATRQAWLALFPLAVLLRRSLRGWLNLRSRGKLSAAFAALSGKAWHAHAAADRRCFARRLRRLWGWARGQPMTAWLLEQVQKLCGRSREYALAYGQPGGHRTSNMLGRVMRSMNRYSEDAQHRHGSEQACERHRRAWALLYNYRPWRAAVARGNGGWRSPAERLNGHRHHDDWLQNLLVSASLAGYRR
jgi:hypothetical protein